MHLIKFSKLNKLFIIFIINQITIAVAHIGNDSISAQNVTDYYEYSSHIYKRTRRQNTDSDQSCQIPNYPPHSTYKIISEPNVMYKPGDNVKQFSTLEISCDKGYKLPPFTVNLSTCLKGQWKNLPPPCLRTCPSLISTASTRVKCDYNSIVLNNCIRPVDGTDVRLSCTEFYEADVIKRNPKRSCKNGRWTPHLAECEPTCGLKSPKATLTIINGEKAASGDYPWHIGIYTNTEEYRCGGSIINLNTILTAAHCLTDNRGNVHPPENYLIAAGKYYRQFRDTRDPYPQYANIRKIHIPERYKSTQTLNSYDIAIITLEYSFNLTSSVQPVCTDLNEEYSYANYLVNNTGGPNSGIVPGWGFTQEGKDLSDVLKELVIPDVPFDQCYSAVPDNFRKFFTSDKICGGYLNQGTSICEGDSGGGLVYNINNRYFVKGVVSTSPATLRSGTAQCNSQQYSLYTSVYHHIAFVRDGTSDNSWKQSIVCAQNDCLNEETEIKIRCRLPNFPLNGKYSFLDQNNKYEPGSFVDINTAILLSCDTGYEANITNFICLEEGIWNHPIGSCTPPQITIQTTTAGCQLPNFPLHGNYSLAGQNKKYEPGSSVNIYNAILLNCDTGFEAKTTFFICVSKGIWNPPTGSCTPLQTIIETSTMGNRLNFNTTEEEEGLISPVFNNFDLDLLQIFNTEHQNYLVSPSSIKLTLAMLLEGSKGNSAQEISEALGIPVNVNSIRRTLNNLTNDLSAKSGNTELNVGNMFAVPNKYAIRQEYKEILQEHYNTQTTSLDFSNSEQFAIHINDWVKSKTKGFITNVIDAEYVNDEDSLMIINALYFKAQWKIKFTETLSRFMLTDRTAEKYLLDVETLQVKSMFRYRFVEELNAQAVELPYSDEEFAMLILLPKENNKVDELQFNLQYSTFSKIIESLELTSVLVSLPKFDIKFSINYKSILAALEIKEIFSRNANLAGMLEQGKTKVNKILYKAKLEVNEKGDFPATPTEASVSDQMDSSSEKVIANRPFLFFVYNMKTKNILFEGRLNLPRPSL